MSVKKRRRLNYLSVSSAPAAPTLSSVTTISNTEINITWTDVSGETGYAIEHSPNGIGSWTQVATRAAGVTSYLDTGLTPATDYYYRVRAYNGALFGPYSNVLIAPTWDTDAYNYFVVTGITDETETYNANQLVLDLKAYGLWTKLDRLFLMSPTSQSAATFCIVSLDQMDPGITIGYDTLGFYQQSEVEFINTNWHPDSTTVGSVNHYTVGALLYRWIQAGSDNYGYVFGVKDGSNESSLISSFIDAVPSTDLYAVTFDPARIVQDTVGDELDDLYSIHRGSFKDIGLYINDTEVDHDSTAQSGVSLPGEKYYLGVLNDGGPTSWNKFSAFITPPYFQAFYAGALSDVGFDFFNFNLALQSYNTSTRGI